MKKILQIKSLKNFRFFNSFEWKSPLCNFNRYNIVYGWNGCGKSTLCDFFHAIELGQKYNSDITGFNKSKFTLSLQEDGEKSEPITHNSYNSISKRVKVFHQNYVNDVIVKQSINHIYYLGNNIGDELDKLTKLKTSITDYENIQIGQEESISSLIKEFDLYKSKRAKTIKDLLGIGVYTASTLLSHFQKYQKTINLLSENNRIKLHKSLNDINKPQIILPRINLISEDNIKDIKNVLTESPTYIAISKFKENVELQKWAHQGFDYHNDNHLRVCEFCNNNISEDRWNELENHFNDSLNRFNLEIKKQINLLNNHLLEVNSIVIKLPQYTQLFNDLHTDYQDEKKSFDEFIAEYNTFIKNITNILNEKKDHIIGNDYILQFEVLLNSYNPNKSIIDDIYLTIDVHNDKSIKFDEEIENAKLQLELHYLAESKETFTNYAIQIDKLQSALIQTKSKKTKLINQAKKIEEAIKDSRIAVDEINNDINFILGRDEIAFAWKEDGYEIRRGDEVVERLSKGEENAIALIYFFNTLSDESNDISDCIVILDDPISSFDTNFYFSAIAYIRSKIQDIGQVFIFTHKFSFYKDMTRMLEPSMKYILGRKTDSPLLMNEDELLKSFEDEYVYLFAKIYTFVFIEKPEDIQEYFPYPNMGRRLLEGFLSFKLPDKNSNDMLKKALYLENSGSNNQERVRAITRLLHNQSHFRKINHNDSQNEPFMLNELPIIFKYLLEFIKEHDEVHYKSLERNIISIEEEQPQVQEAHAVIELVSKEIPWYETPVSAGKGNPLDEEHPNRYITVYDDKADYAVSISGDSMESSYSDGDVILIQKCDVVEHGKIGVFLLNGESYCKKMVDIPNTSQKPMLVSLNSKKYSPLIIGEFDTCEFLGLVLDKIEVKDEDIIYIAPQYN